MERTGSRKNEAKRANMQFRASKKGPRGDLRKHRILQVAALRNIRNGEELFVNYVGNFMLQKISSS